MITLEWRSASNPSGNCVEAAALPGVRWATASNSSANCVEVAMFGPFASASNPNGSCVEVAQALEFASASESNGHCVEVARPQAGAAVGVRDSKNHGMGVLGFTAAQWQRVLRDPRAAFRPVRAELTPLGAKDGHEVLYALDCPCRGNTLFFTAPEVGRFCAGVGAGMFALA